MTSPAAAPAASPRSGRASQIARLLGLFALVGTALLPALASAKAPFFRNYPDLKWNVIKTEHFNVFYPESRNPDSEHYLSAEFTARKSAYVAEEMYPLICGQFNYYLDETVNIVLHDQTDDLTGFTVPNWDWIVISARHSDFLWRWRGHHDWLRNVLYHEFAHVVSLKAGSPFAEEAFGVQVGVNWFDGRINTAASASTFLMGGDPWFWVEGGAEYYTDVAGINTWTSNRDMRMRMDFLEGTDLDLVEQSDYASANGGMDGEHHYQGGYFFALYLEERFGEGVYQSFALKKDEKGWSPDWLTVIEDTLNISAKELHEDFRNWARAKYRKVKDGILADGAAMGEDVETTWKYWQLETPENLEQDAFVRSLKGADRYKWRRDREKDGAFYNWFPRFSSDGTRWGVFGYGRTGQNVTITPRTESQYPVWNAALPKFSDEITAQEDATVAKPITIAATDETQFDFSPDGRKIVFVCDEDLLRTKKVPKISAFTRPSMDLDGYNWHQLCVRDLDEMESVAMEEYRKYWKDEDPMAEDLERLEKMRRGVYVDKAKEAKGKKARRHWIDFIGNPLTMPVHVIGKPAIRRVSDPSWSPDGRHIAYVKYADANQNLWVVDLETQETHPITKFEDGTRIEGLDWSPDGKELVFGAFRWNQADIYAIGMDGTGGRPLTFDRFEDREPHWGHDGNIYWTSDRVGGIHNVFRLNPRVKPGRKDADLDGILDENDRCPNEPETRNLYRDTDGCPDEIPIRVTAEKIQIDDKIFFELDQATIKPESLDLVDAIARVIVEHEEIKRIEVQGHTDSQGTPEHNLLLSHARAVSVRERLIAQGVDGGRLSPMGYGQGLPLVEGATEEAFAVNRRVEFVILERDAVSTVVEQKPGGAGEQVYACGQSPEEQALRNAYLVRLTHTYAGAFTPWLTPQGNLLYSSYSPFGWKEWGLRCQDFKNEVVDDTALVIAEGAGRLDVAQEEYPDYGAVTSPVGADLVWTRNPLVVPIVQVATTSLSHIGVELGVFFDITDVLDTNELQIYAGTGDDTTIFGRYDYRGLWPEFYVGGFFRSIKFDYGFLLDDDGSATTIDDRFLGDIKGSYLVYGGFGGLRLPFSADAVLDLSTFQYGLSYVGVDDGKRASPIWHRAVQDVSFSLGADLQDYRSRTNGNLRGVSVVTFTWSPNYTIQRNQSLGGYDADDGQLFKNYYFNQFDLSYAGFIKMPWKKAHQSGTEDLGHTLQIDTQVGLTDRNVPYNDELRGGGSGRINFRNPYGSNTVFAGYPGYSLAGETALVLNAAYRFPLARQIDKKLGPMYFEALYMSFFGTVGNFWSYRVKGDAATVDFSGERVLADEEDRVGGRIKQPTGIQREWPGMIAAENGNYILADAGVELRLVANLWNRSQFLSSIRIAYGFMPIAGRGDLDGDDVYTNSVDPTLDNRSDEKEPAGLRLYFNIGTGW